MFQTTNQLIIYIYISLKNQPCADDSPNHRSIVDRLRLLEFSHRRSTSLAPFNPPLPRADTITWQRLPRTPLGQGISCDMNPTIHFWPVIENGLWCLWLMVCVQHIIFAGFWPKMAKNKLAGDATSKIHGQIVEICDGETCTMRARLQCVCVCVCFFHAVTLNGSVLFAKHKREWRSRTHIRGPRKWWVFSSLPTLRTCSPAGNGIYPLVT